MSPEAYIQNAQPIHPENLARPSYTAVIPDATRTDWAKTISDWTMQAADEKLMLPKSLDEILDLFSKRHSVVLVGEGGRLLSHAAATFIYPDGSIEVGAVCTDVGNRQKGFGRGTVSALLTHLNQLYPDRRFFALANKGSVPLFKRLGGTEMETSELHKDVWLACKICPNRPSAEAHGEHVCCDTPFDLTSSGKKANPVSLFDAGAHANGTNGTNHAKI